MPEPLFTCSREELEAEFQAEITLRQAQSNRPPTWQEIWDRTIIKVREVALNIWQCVIPKRWQSTAQTTHTASELIDLLEEDIDDCAEPPYITWDDTTGVGGGGD